MRGFVLLVVAVVVGFWVAMFTYPLELLVALGVYAVAVAIVGIGVSVFGAESEPVNQRHTPVSVSPQSWAWTAPPADEDPDTWLN